MYEWIELPNEAIQELDGIITKVKGFADDATQVTQPVSTPLPTAWEGETAERVQFQGEFDTQVKTVMEVFNQTRDVIIQARDDEPPTVKRLVYVGK